MSFPIETKVLGKKGYISIGNFFLSYGINPSTTSRKTLVNFEIPIFSETFKNTKVNVLSNDNVKPLNTILTKTGGKLCLTDKHEVLTISAQGNIIWKVSKDLKKGDYLISKLWVLNPGIHAVSR